MGREGRLGGVVAVVVDGLVVARMRRDDGRQGHLCLRRLHLGRRMPRRRGLQVEVGMAEREGHGRGRVGIGSDRGLDHGLVRDLGPRMIVSAGGCS